MFFVYCIINVLTRKNLIIFTFLTNSKFISNLTCLILCFRLRLCSTYNKHINVYNMCSQLTYDRSILYDLLSYQRQRIISNNTPNYFIYMPSTIIVCVTRRQPTTDHQFPGRRYLIRICRWMLRETRTRTWFCGRANVAIAILLCRYFAAFQTFQLLASSNTCSYTWIHTILI